VCATRRCGDVGFQSADTVPREYTLQPTSPVMWYAVICHLGGVTIK